MSLEQLIADINAQGLLVCDLGQRRTMNGEAQESVGWMGKLRSVGDINDSRVKWFEAGYGPTALEALQAALRFAKDPTPRNNGMPTMLHKAVVRVPEPPASLEDML